MAIPLQSTHEKAQAALGPRQERHNSQDTHRLRQDVMTMAAVHAYAHSENGQEEEDDKDDIPIDQKTGRLITNRHPKQPRRQPAHKRLDIGDIRARYRQHPRQPTPVVGPLEAPPTSESFGSLSASAIPTMLSAATVLPQSVSQTASSATATPFTFKGGSSESDSSSPSPSKTTQTRVVDFLSAFQQTEYKDDPGHSTLDLRGHMSYEHVSARVGNDW